ncbi:hypothetical protein FVEG_15721 [Fusarium verticillioides 7600]|uniref:Zn(2)-C6 fungal-type domain-containing protein n=1 Tax=Gibberella moniliformis (strain M3125 / FGSC 7600) TaxID=334819 RepID=W7MIS2_GIBM7|nr:hypothetical protein FVEG_15721 [Fusarium verticillioides 7600]EWG44777.1 hypothetical protein FVEG_15721 [Fusarium verticillioides 7600]
MTQPRLRGCCDSCTKSKLKCSGEMPCCQRCRIRGLDCVYSQARRAGRPRLKPKTSKASMTACVRREPQTSLTSCIKQPVNSLPCPKTELPIVSNPEVLLCPPDSQGIAFLLEDPWASTPCPSSDVTQPSSICDSDDLILQNMLLSNTEGFDLSPGSLKHERGQDHALFNDGLENTCPVHVATDGVVLDHSSAGLSGLCTVASEDAENTSSYISEVDIEINAIMATITDIARRPIGSYHLGDHPCATSWPQLLAKAQLLMYTTGSGNSSSLRLDAVLQVLWAAEQVQKRILGCSTCISRSMELSSILALLYDWISSRIADALEDLAALQSCRLKIGDSVLTGQNGIIGTYELVKYRITRAIRVIENMNNTSLTMREVKQGQMYKMARHLLEAAESRLEAISGMIDLLESKQLCSI